MNGLAGIDRLGKMSTVDNIAVIENEFLIRHKKIVYA
jgi:hypothetical protein